MITLKLRAREERRLRAGHLWAYSNEIDTDERYKTIEPGTLCRLLDSRGKPLGVGYVNPRTLLALRLLSSDVSAPLDQAWFERRIAAALALRERIYPGPYYRLVYGEADGLPGLVVDRYGAVCVVQITTAGIERLKDVVLAALQAVLKPEGIVLRNDSSARELEGLPAYTEVVGTVPDRVEIDEDGVRYALSLTAGQKTGFFFDQRDNRTRLQRYVRGRSVLDVFSYVGAWALRSAHYGASKVSCIDSSESALDAAKANAALNGVELEAIRGDALAAMKALRGDARTFDVIVVDPPALIKRRKDHDAGIEHYAALNRAAMQLLPGDGILISCSCSHHLEPEQLQRVLLREARAAGRRLQILEQGGQGPDHPVHPAIVETRYLKAFVCRVING
ncbi:class I SAM-dependent rRNA methyltransferase [Sinimarinibacterium sp. CAU 1509]|uniref:class I SAM-dependent rRNA methyltransferase n=1 Tax=Sinimarinibacterium sp. CAU 1509 TaxID=2562283 RepID=UPI0010AB8913|nr:class I SAM-dependent rRNA methyltransferase [Sinimarinibacterium sp. CAU 1509]TJY61046.1 class I SAM-dependent rRNA methyltransferase [Sinimarinibacterium sp. CAU 1509]